MQLSEIEEGMRVTYRPRHEEDRPLSMLESGIVASTNAHYVFVRFGADQHSKACRAEDLRSVS